MIQALWFLAPFGAYLRTMTGTFLADDSPETIAAMVALEHQHPPGYPLLTLAGKLVSYWPVGGVALRINLAGAALAALACWLTARLAARLMRRMELGEPIALAGGSLAAILLGFAWTFWSQALSAKGAIYAANAVLLAYLFDLAIRAAWGDVAPGRAAAAAALATGLGLANHWMSVVAAAPGFAVAWWAWRRSIRVPVRRVAVTAVIAVLGLSVYLLLPIRAVTPLLLNWGRPETLKSFAWVVSRAQYAPVEAGKRVDGYWHARIRHLEQVAAREWTLLFLPAGAIGVAAAWGVLTGELVLLGSVAAFVFGAVLVVSNPPLDRIFITEPYLLPAIQVWSLLGGIGLAWAASRLKRGEATAWILAAGSAVWLAGWHGPGLDESRYYVSYDYGWNLLEGAPPRAVVFCEGDFDLFALMYQNEVEERRSDVAVAAAVFLDYDWYRETVHRMLPDVVPRSHKLLEYTVRPVRPLLYTSQHAGGEGVLRPVGLTVRPPLGTGYGLEDSARNWRALRFRGIWDAYERGPALARSLITSYGTQMARLGQAARAGDPALAIAAMVKAGRLPQELVGRVYTRYTLAQYLMTVPAQSAEHRQRLLAAAEGELVKITAEAPGFWRAYLLLGNLAFLRGDRPAARRALELALSALPAAGAEPDRARVERLLRGL
ncbi:MAG: DUF2723 domain-containing protein [Candidatus Coatesbacteria bacterium]